MAHRNPNAKPLPKSQTGLERRGNKDAAKQANENLVKTGKFLADSLKGITKPSTGGGGATPTSSSSAPIKYRVTRPVPKQNITPTVNPVTPKPKVNTGSKPYQYSIMNTGNYRSFDKDKYKEEQKKKREEQRLYEQSLEGQIDKEIEKVTTTGTNTKKYNLYSNLLNDYWNDYVYNVDPEEFQKWYDDNVVIDHRFNLETGKTEDVPTFKASAAPPPLGTDKNGNTVDITEAWQYCQAYDAAITKYINEQDEAIKKGTATKYAGQDDNATDSLLDVFRAAVDPKKSGSQALKEYTRDYLWNPLVNGDYKALGINTLWNLGETLDYAGVGARAIVASNDIIGTKDSRYDRNGREATFKGQNEWYYDKNKKDTQTKLVNLGADKILRGSAKHEDAYDTGGSEHHKFGEHDSIEKIESRIKDAGLWDDYLEMKQAWAEHQQEWRDEGPNIILNNLKSAYTSPSANFHADTGNLAKDIAIEVLLDPTLMLGGSASGFAKTSARSTSEIAVRTVAKNFIIPSINKESAKTAEGAIKRFIKNNANDLLTKNHDQISNEIKHLGDVLEENGAIQRTRAIGQVDKNGHWKTINFDDELAKEVFASIDSTNYKVVRSMHMVSELMNKADATMLKSVFAVPYLPIAGAVRGYKGARTEISRLVDTAIHREEVFGEPMGWLPRKLDNALTEMSKKNQLDEIVARNQFGKIQSRARAMVSKSIGDIEQFYAKAKQQPSSEVWDEADTFIQSTKDLMDAMDKPLADFRDGRITAAQYGEAVDAQIASMSGVATTRSELKAYLEDLYRRAPEEDYARLGKIYDDVMKQMRQVESIEKQLLDREVQAFTKELRGIKTTQDLIEFSKTYYVRTNVHALPETFDIALLAKQAELGEKITPDEFETVLRNLERNCDMSIDLNPRDADIPLPASVTDSKGFSTSIPQAIHKDLEDLQKYFTKEKHDWMGVEFVRQYMFSISKVDDMPPKALHDVLRRGIVNLTLRSTMGANVDLDLLTKMRDIDRTLYDNSLSIENVLERDVDYQAIHLDHLTVFDEYMKNPHFQKVLTALRDPSTPIGQALSEVKKMHLSSKEYADNPVYELMMQINNLLDMNNSYFKFRNAISDEVAGLTDRQVYAIIDRLFGITKGNPRDFLNKSLSQPNKFMDDLETLLVAEYGEVRCSLDGARAQMNSFDSDLFKNYADEIEDPVIQARIKELAQPGHIDPMNDVRVQMLYTILRDKTTIKDYNALQENEREVIFSDIETTGLNKDRNGLTSIAFKKWIPIDEDASLSDILDIIEDKSSETLLKRSLSDEELNRIDDGLLNGLFAKDPKLAHTDRETKLEAYKKFYAEEANGKTIFSSEEDMMKFINQYITDASVTKGKKWYQRVVRTNERATPCLVFHNANGFDTKFLTARMRSLGVGIPKGAVRHISDIEKYSHNTLARLRALEGDVILTSEQKDFVMDQIITLAREVKKYDNGFKFLDPRALEMALYDLQKLSRSSEIDEFYEAFKTIERDSVTPIVKEFPEEEVPVVIKDVPDEGADQFDFFKEIANAPAPDSVISHSKSHTKRKRVKRKRKANKQKTNKGRYPRTSEPVIITSDVPGYVPPVKDVHPSKVSVDEYPKDSLQANLGLPNSDKFKENVLNSLNTADFKKLRHDLKIACQEVGHMQNRYEKHIIMKIQDISDDFATAKTYQNLMREAQRVVPDRPWSYLSYDVFFRGREAAKYFDWSSSAKITTDELHSMKTFTDWIEKKMQYSLRAGADELIEPYEETCRDMIDLAIRFSRDVDQYNEYSFLKYIKQPSTPMEAYLMAQKLYDDIFKYVDGFWHQTKDVPLEEYLKKFIKGEQVDPDFVPYFSFLNTPQIDLGMIRKFIEREDGTSPLFGKDERSSQEIYESSSLRIFRDNNLQAYIFNDVIGGPSHYIDTLRTPQQKAVAEIQDMQLRISRRTKSFAEQSSFVNSSDFAKLQTVKIQNAFDHVNGILDIFRDMSEKNEEFWKAYVHFKKTLNIKRMELFDAYRLNRMLRDTEGKVASDEQLISEILFTNGLRKVIPRTGNSLHMVQIDELLSKVDNMQNDYLVKFEEGDHVVIAINPKYKPLFDFDDAGKRVAKFPGSSIEYHLMEEDKLGFPEFEELMEDFEIKLDDLDPSTRGALEDVYELMKKTYDDLDDITDGASRGTLGITASYNKEVKLASSFTSNTVRETLRTDFTGDSRIWAHDSFDKSLLGDFDNSWKLGSNSDDFDPLITLVNTLDEASGRTMSERHLIDTFFGDNSSCKISDLGNDFSNEELLSILKDSDEFVCVSLHAANTSSGFEVRQMRITDTLSIEMAKRNGAIYVPYDLYLNMTDMINNAEITNKLLKYWTKFTVALKITQLVHPGTWIRNWIDATSKMAGDEGSLGSALHYEFIAAKRLFQAQKIIREAGTDISEATWKASNYDRYMTYDDYMDLVGFKANESVSGGEAARSKKMIQEYFERGRKDEALGIDGFDTIGKDTQRFEQAYDAEELEKLLKQAVTKNPGLFDKLSRERFIELFNARKLQHDFEITDDTARWYYNEIANTVIDTATKNIRHPVKYVKRGFDKVAGGMLTPMSQTELIVRYSQLLALRDVGHTNASAYKHIIDTHFNYNNKPLRMKCLEAVIPFATFQYNNLLYWIKQIDNNPRMIRWIEQTFGEASFDGIEDIKDEENDYVNQSLEYRISSGGIPLGSGGMYFKLNPSYLDAMNWFYGGPDDFLSNTIPPIRSLAKAGIDTMGFDSYKMFNEVQFSSSPQEWAYELAESMPAGNYVAGFVRHFTDAQPWTRLDVPLQQELVRTMPSLFGAVKPINKRNNQEFADWQADLAKDGKWYDSNLGKVVDISQYNEDGLNNPKLSFEGRRILEFLMHGRLYDQNQSKFVDKDDFIPGGLNRQWDFSKEGQWEEYCRLKKKYLGLEYDLNTRTFVKHKSAGGLNAENLDWDTICALNAEMGIFWDANQGRFVEEKYLTDGGFNKEKLSFPELCAYQYAVKGKVWDKNAKEFVKVTDPIVTVKAYNSYNEWEIFNNLGFNPTNITPDNATYMEDGMLRSINGKYVLSNDQLSNDKIFKELVAKYSFSFGRRFRKFGYHKGFAGKSYNAVPVVPPKPYSGFTIGNKTFGYTKSTSNNYAGLRMAVTGYKAYDDYYKYEYNYNYSYHNPTGVRTGIKRFDFYRQDHQPLFRKFAMYQR